MGTKQKQGNDDKRLTHSMAHYILAIHRLKESKGYARVTDIAKDLKLTKGSVSIALGNLKKIGLIREEDGSKFLLLTEDGHREVHRVLSARSLLFYFLRDILKVSESVAKQDSCLMEHLIGSETQEKFFAFMKRLTDGEQIDASTLNFKSDLNLRDFNSAGEFIGGQTTANYRGEDID
ncbi:MAG TPA: metal-dependent transcriptional regulator [Bacteriovoracaceae bacterium]|nr:metal-dependent transcriptional regulator [Bacteriovoracaceae bacterium]